MYHIWWINWIMTQTTQTTPPPPPPPSTSHLLIISLPNINWFSVLTTSVFRGVSAGQDMTLRKGVSLRGHKCKRGNKCEGARACAQVQALVPEVFASSLPESLKSFEYLITCDCPHHSSCFHFRAKVSFISPRHLPKFWDKKSKATTKVTQLATNKFI